MNFSMLKSLQGAMNCLVRKILIPKTLQLNDDRRIHQIFSKYSSMINPTNNLSIFNSMSFLKPILPQFNQTCGMKQRGHLTLRCKGCYFVTRQGRLYVMCRDKPRHKQMQMMKSFKNRRILTFAHQKKRRDWY